MGYADPEMHRAYQRQYQREYQHRRREAWFREHGPCAQCGSWDELELDHRDRRDKSQNLKNGGGAIWSWSKVKREAELAKCQVLCAHCHLAKTRRESSTAMHGTRSKYVGGCRCTDCRAAEAAYARARRAQSTF